MTTRSSTPKTCFISAPAGAELDVLRIALEDRGFRVLVPHELAVGTDWASEIQKQIKKADLVIGVLTSRHQSAWVLFELGQASALGRRIVLITSPESDPIPFSLHQFLVLRINLDNEDAIGFALDQLLSAPEQPQKRVVSPEKKLLGLGAKADEMMIRLDQALVTNDWRSLEDLVGEILRSSGADVVVSSPNDQNVRADFAVWSDVLEPFVGNPLLIEVKLRIRDKSDASHATHQLLSYLGASSSPWGLLLYGDGPESEHLIWRGIPPNVLVMSLRSLIDKLRTRAFPELIRDLRNRRVHGIS